MNFEPILFGLINLGFILLGAPLYMTIVKKVKARAQGRYGPPLLQGYWQIAKLLRKEVIYSEYASPISRIAPNATLAILMVASLFVPVFWIPNDGIGGNIIIFLYLLAMTRFLLALLGLDTGSTFGGMGSSREMSLSAVIEPTTIIVFAAMAFVTGTLSIHEMFANTAGAVGTFNPTIILLSVSLFILIIIETGRIPVDNPETHLELTMIHEGMLLDTSGRNLALFELSHAVKQTLLMALLINLLIPLGIALECTIPAILIGITAFVMKGSLLSVIIGLSESSFAKMRFFSLPNLFMLAFFLSMLTIFIEVIL